MPKVNDSNSNSSASTPAHTQTAVDSHGASDGRVATFIRKVYNILEEQLFPDIVDWSADGLAIVIKKPTEFSQKVLPKYFKHNHISSFIRQLNMYSFQKKRSRHAGHIYAHDLFQKGAKHLLCQIKRKVKDFANTSTGSGEVPVTNTPNVNATPVNANTSNPGHPDVSALMNENQLLKNLQEQNMLKLQALEQKVKELSAVNQRLTVQMQQGKETSSNNNMMSAQQPKVQQIYNLNTAMLVGGRNPFSNMVPTPKIESESTNSLSPVKGLSLRINKPGPQNEAERYMIGGQNAFTIGGPFAGVNSNVNANPNRIAKTKNEEEVSPSATRPSPQNSDNANSELDAWGQHLLHQHQQQQQQQNHQAFMLNGAQNFQNIAQQRLSIGQTQGFLSNLSDNKDSLQMPGFVHNLGKREMELDDLKQNEQQGRKMIQRPWNDLGATLNLSDIKKFHSNLFSSIGDKDFDPKQTDNEIDLLCFE